MKLIWIAAALLLIGVTGAAAQEAAEPPVFEAFVSAQSANVRSAPAETAEVVGSVFSDEQLEVVGRNLDGTWFEVRRPGRMNKLGWMLTSLLDYTFLPELLPLTDLTTGLTGETPLEADPGFAIYTLGNLALRAEPSTEAEQIGIVSFFSTVPVVARNQDGSWLQVNYLGTVGWVAAFNTRQREDVLTVAVAPGLPPLPTFELAPGIVIIPPEVQLAEVERMRAYVLESRALANQLESFWAIVLNGEVMPCEPPPFVLDYLYSQESERAFPELPRYVPRLNEGIGFLNNSIDTLYTCGVVNPDLVIYARNEAINSRVVFDATLDILDNIESIVRRRR